MKYKVILNSVVPATAIVFVDAKTTEDAREIAITSCGIDDFEIEQLGTIETADIEQL